MKESGRDKLVQRQGLRVPSTCAAQERCGVIYAIPQNVALLFVALVEGKGTPGGMCVGAEPQKRLLFASTIDSAASTIALTTPPWCQHIEHGSKLQLAIDRKTFQHSNTMSCNWHCFCRLEWPECTLQTTFTLSDASGTQNRRNVQLMGKGSLPTCLVPWQVHTDSARSLHQMKQQRDRRTENLQARRETVSKIPPCCSKCGAPAS